VLSHSDVLLDCSEQCDDRCQVTEATTALTDCALNGADGEPGGADDCSDVCFPPAP
jgi:hypothetical protein